MSAALRAARPRAVDAQFSVTVGGGSFTLEAELTLQEGVLVLFGPSGTGKSLTIQVLAGLLVPRQGVVRVAGAVLYDGARKILVPAHKRQIGYVPQQPSLFPFCTVAENVAFGLPRPRRKPSDPDVRRLLDELGIAHLALARPGGLSGGERQRVALARALAVRPRLLLLDEPFVSIDHEGRSVLHTLLRATLRRHEIPAVFVTHDPEEAVAIGDDFVRFERGRTCGTGPVTSLGGARQVVIRGKAAEPARPLEEGRVRLELSGVSLEGASELLTPRADGSIELDLRSRHPRPRK